VNLDVHRPPLTYLSEYYFFTGDMKSLQPNNGVIPFEPVAHLFSDYADKLRFVWMPPGKSAVYKKDDVFEFPVGSVLIKNFFYHHDFTDHSLGRNIIETRLLVRRESGWDALPYIWNDDQTDARLEITGDLKELSFINEDGKSVAVNYLVPNKNQCKGCHAHNGNFNPIGPKARYLNTDYEYSSGQTNQLEKWVEQGYLSGYDSNMSISTVAKWNDTASGSLEERALAYLDINCGTCHSRAGSAHSSGLYLTLSERSSAHLGICKSPVAAGKGTGGFRFDISPGKPEESILVYRMESTDPSVMMPELGRALVHEEGVALIKKWIRSMDSTCN
jgi:uncharacterized repeat protein (TIGR03806 family)